MKMTSCDDEMKVTKPLANIEKAQKLIIEQQRRIQDKQDDIDEMFGRIRDASALIATAIEEMRSGEIRFISRDLEFEIRKAGELTLAIDQKVEDQATTTN